MRRPGCAASFAGPHRSGPSHVTVPSRSGLSNDRPHTDAGPSPDRRTGPTSSRIVSPTQKNACRLAVPARSTSRVRRSSRPAACQRVDGPVDVGCRHDQVVEPIHEVRMRGRRRDLGLRARRDHGDPVERVGVEPVPRPRAGRRGEHDRHRLDPCQVARRDEAGGAATRRLRR